MESGLFGTSDERVREDDPRNIESGIIDEEADNEHGAHGEAQQKQRLVSVALLNKSLNILMQILNGSARPRPPAVPEPAQIHHVHGHLLQNQLLCHVQVSSTVFSEIVHDYHVASTALLHHLHLRVVQSNLLPSSIDVSLLNSISQRTLEFPDKFIHITRKYLVYVVISNLLFFFHLTLILHLHKSTEFYIFSHSIYSILFSIIFIILIIYIPSYIYHHQIIYIIIKLFFYQLK